MTWLSPSLLPFYVYLCSLQTLTWNVMHAVNAFLLFVVYLALALTLQSILFICFQNLGVLWLLK